MSSNYLKFNDDKLELSICHSKHAVRPNITSTDVGDESISPAKSHRNIGVIYDETLLFDNHISSITKTSFWHLRSIWGICRYLDNDSLLT